MTARPIVQRAAARRDVEEAIAHLLAEGGAQAGLAFIDALESACRHIAENPASGSPRWAHELDMPGLRSWRLVDLPWLVVCVARDDHIDVWRLLHAHRDMPTTLQ